VSWILIWTFRH